MIQFKFFFLAVTGLHSLIATRLLMCDYLPLSLSLFSSGLLQAAWQTNILLILTLQGLSHNLHFIGDLRLREVQKFAPGHTDGRFERAENQTGFRGIPALTAFLPPFTKANVITSHCLSIDLESSNPGWVREGVDIKCVFSLKIFFLIQEWYAGRGPT